MPRPSIFGSQTYARRVPGSARPRRASNSRRSSGDVWGPQHSFGFMGGVRPSPPAARRARGAPPPASTQDYLAAIYALGGSGKPVIGARLAKHMSVSAPAVTEAMHRMARGGYVKVGHGKELTLTPKGREIAEVMARRHRLLERWLTDTLGLNSADAHEEAQRLQRALSPRA